MCCFSGPVAEVARTNLFARDAGHGRQYLVYQMEVRAAGPTAMILPLPVPPRAPDDAVRFLDLRACRGFFADLHRPFAGRSATTAGGGARLAPLPAPRLEVHRVGSFDASFAPSLDDLDRLDPRFRLPRAVWPATCADGGFAVFMLHDLAQLTTIEPMALVWPRRDPTRLFFPTVHIHDGAAHATAHFDHNLFFQHGGMDDEAIVAVGNHARRAASSHTPAHAFASTLTAGGVLDGDRPVQVARFAGELPNRDAWIGGAAHDPELAALAAWDGAPWPVDRAIAVVARLARARMPEAADDLPAAHALVGLLPWTLQRAAYGEATSYVAPEYLRGQPLDARTDVFALGVLLHDLIAGHVPDPSPLGELIRYLQQPPAALGVAIDPVIARATRADPAVRFASLGELVAALAAIAGPDGAHHDIR